MSQSWKSLPLESCGTCPPLFFSYDRSPTGYELLLTDLIHIWSASLTKKQILARAAEEDTSVDPSEDAGQYSVLLQKIGDALRGVKGSKISLTRSAKEHDLELVTTTKLPDPLPQLEWTLRLSRLPQSALTRRILLPLLQGEKDHAARLQSLIDLLKEKDWALSKVFEKIESSGVDLSRAFPGLSGMRAERRGASALTQVSKVIKGVAPFDEKAWNSRFGDQKSGSDLGVNIATELDAASSDGSWYAAESKLEDWWTRLECLGSTSGKGPSKKRASPPPPKRPQQAVEDEEMEESDDDFQRQATPPRLRGCRSAGPVNSDSAKEAQPSNQAGDETTSGSAAAIRSPAPSRSTGKQTRTSKGLGTIGAKSKTKPVSRHDEDQKSPEPETAPQKAKSKTPDKPKGLGAIGGRKAPPAPRPTRTTDSTTQSESSDSGEPEKTVQPPADDLTQSESDEEPKSRRQTTRKGLRASTEREDEETAIPKPEKQPQKSRPVRGGLGQIGGKKRKEQEEQEAKRASAKEMQEKEVEVERTTTSPEARNGPDTKSSQATASPKPKRSGKLGMIGGRKAARSNDDRESQRPVSLPAEETPGRHPESKGTGKMHTKNPDPSSDATAAPAAAAAERQSQPQQSTESGPPGRSGWEKKEDGMSASGMKEETAEERANRKREELRRQLETRGPAKKKRRF